MTRRIALLSSIGMLLAGCQSADDLSSTQSSTGVVAAATVDESSSHDGDASATSGENEADASTPQVAAGFNPPFPDRTDLFQPPRSGQGTVRRDEEHGETIELKGFVDVDGPQVVLAIDGVLSPIPEGGEKYGVQVISIHPPSVVLQRGRNRWTASLE